MKASKLARKESLTGFLFCLPSIIGMLVFFVIPFCLCLYMSFTESSGSVRFVGLKNYAEVLKSAAFRLAAGNTLKFIVIAVPAIILVSLFIALLLFVGIPLPGTGAWTGTLAASILDMDFKSTIIAVMLGVLLAGIIMMVLSVAGFGMFLK